VRSEGLAGASYSGAASCGMRARDVDPLGVHAVSRDASYANCDLSDHVSSLLAADNVSISYPAELPPR
jgi:hypothetical protein